MWNRENGLQCQSASVYFIVLVKSCNAEKLIKSSCLTFENLVFCPFSILMDLGFLVFFVGGVAPGSLHQLKMFSVRNNNKMEIF